MTVESEKIIADDFTSNCISIDLEVGVKDDFGLLVDLTHGGHARGRFLLHQQREKVQIHVQQRHPRRGSRTLARVRSAF